MSPTPPQPLSSKSSRLRLSIYIYCGQIIAMVAVPWLWGLAMGVALVGSFLASVVAGRSVGLMGGFSNDNPLLLWFTAILAGTSFVSGIWMTVEAINLLRHTTDQRRRFLLIGVVGGFSLISMFVVQVIIDSIGGS